jgi:hypothetical protein
MLDTKGCNAFLRNEITSRRLSLIASMSEEEKKALEEEGEKHGLGF